MPFVFWDESFSVHVPELDNEHKIIVNIINDIHDAFIAGKGNEMILKAVDALVDYTQTHFKNEELFMEELHFEKLDEHKQKHEQLIRDVKSFKVRIQDHETIGFFEIMDFLRKWLFNHILSEDMEYSPVALPG